MDQLIIAIDGFSACGKSTLAKELASRLDLVYIDTGAMYRAVTLYYIQEDLGLDDSEAFEAVLDKIKVSFQNIEGENRCFLNGVDVEKEIRSRQVSDMVSEVAVKSEIRAKMVALQRTMGESMNLVMDGRDIGTVVYPNANFKFFMTAEENIRVERRLAEFQIKGVVTTRAEVRANLRKRDYIDSNRKDSPLRVAENAIVIDNSYLSREEQIDLVCKIIKLGSNEK